MVYIFCAAALAVAVVAVLMARNARAEADSAYECLLDMIARISRQLTEEEKKDYAMQEDIKALKALMDSLPIEDLKAAAEAEAKFNEGLQNIMDFDKDVMLRGGSANV